MPHHRGVSSDMSQLGVRMPEDWPDLGDGSTGFPPGAADTVAGAPAGGRPGDDGGSVRAVGSGAVDADTGGIVGRADELDAGGF